MTIFLIEYTVHNKTTQLFEYRADLGRGMITRDDWESTAGGESAHLAPDPKDNEIVYGGSYGGFLTRYNHHNEMKLSH